MDYSRYEAEDFAANASYLRYYFKLDPVDVFFWQNWISTHPEKLDVIMRADRLIRYTAMHLPEGEAAQQLENTHRTLAGDAPRELAPAAPTMQSRLTRLFAVAGILAAVLVGIAFMFHYSTRLSKAAPSGMQHSINNSHTPLTIHLEDSSRVILQSGARLSYPRKFAGDKREVFLEGDAVFELRHDARRPFYVSNNRLMAHLQGSSFSVSTNRRRGTIAVSISNGRVEVHERKDQ
ncbi:FecR domain-containing protein [uncultured Chitinophaga sp.]|jgi:Fe2+-dicitrate sensor, membrane component|uniref:FecR domain-containing protein n=1 Tax=uncultured Chitinophaga sp. TaxID=339340 RepID=UPI002604C77A|nr:FecR domain-containing protein [uncultured Chitinophaga sp.]